MPHFLKPVELFRRRHVERLAERDVELVVGADAADPRRVIVALVLLRDQLALRHDRHRDHVRAFIKELRGRIHQHAVLLDDEQKAVLGEARPVGEDEIERRSERLDLLGDADLAAVGHGIDLRLAGADEGDDALRPDRHMARIGNERIEADMEAVRQLDLGQILLDRVGLGAGLRNGRNVGRRAGGLELSELFQIARIVLRECRRGYEQYCRRHGQRQAFMHHNLPVLPFMYPV